MTDPSLFASGVSYTPAEELIMNHIIESPQEFLLQSIQEVARGLGVSDATVSRFARHAGFADFKALKAAVAARSLGPADKMSASIDGGAGDVRAFLRQQRENLDRTLEGLDVDAFEAAAAALANARRVLIHGKGAAACVAELLRFRLRRYGLAVELLPAGGSELMEGLVHAREGDVLVAFGFQRVPAEDQALLDFGAKAGCTTLLFTDRIVRSGGGPAPDIELYTYRGEPRAYHSMASAVALVDALVVAVGARLDGGALDALEQLKDLKRAYAHFLPR